MQPNNLHPSANGPCHSVTSTVQKAHERTSLTPALHDPLVASGWDRDAIRKDTARLEATTQPVSAPGRMSTLAGVGEEPLLTAPRNGCK